MEEKWLIEALALAGVAARPFPPAPRPLPLGPLSRIVGTAADDIALVLDRCVDRTVASAILPVTRAGGVGTVDAGLAATGDRLAVATLLAKAGLPRPRTYLVASEDAGIEAFSRFGGAVALLPLDQGSVEIALIDREIAEAVLEHREVLGGSRDVVSLMQDASDIRGRQTIIVVGHRAVAVSRVDAGDWLDEAIEFAERASRALHASSIGIEIVRTGQGPVVWDVQPVPEFRHAHLLTEHSVQGAIANLVLDRLHQVAAPAETFPVDNVRLEFDPIARQEVGNGVVLTA